MSRPAPLSLPVFARLNAWRWSLLALAVTGMLIGMSWLHFYREARENAEADLAVIAALKAEEVENWLREKRSSTLHPVSGFLATALRQWQSAPRTPASDQVLRERMAFYLQRNPDAIRVNIHDATGKFLISTDPALIHDARHLDIDEFKRSATTNRSTVLDFHFMGKGDVHVGVISPLLEGSPQGVTRIGFVLLEIDPRRQLFPSVQKWPASSRSAESLLWQQRGEFVELASPLRFEPDAPPGKRLPLKALKASPEQLAARQPITAPGKDYRQVEVLRRTHPVAGTHWWLVAKIDAEEVFAPALRNSLQFSALLLGLMVAGCLLLFLVQRNALSRASQQQAEQEHKKLHAFINAVPESLLMLDLDGNILIINDTAARRLGHVPSDITGRNIFSLLPPDLAESRRSAMQQACTHNQVVSLQDTRNGADFLSMVYPLGDGRHVVLLATDITQQNAAARARDAAIATLQSFIDHLPGTAYVKDHESRVLIANQGFKELLGLDPAAMIGKLSSDIFPGEFGEKMVADDLRILASGKTEVLEEAFNGRFYESTKFVIPGRSGPAALGGITLDVTARHLAEAHLRDSEAQLRSLTDNLPDSYLYQIITLPDGTRRFTYLSSGVERVHGIPAADILADGTRLYATIDPEQVPALSAEEDRCRTERRDFFMELRMRRADGQYGRCNVRSRPRPGPDGGLIWDGVVQDTTARHAVEDALRETEERLRNIATNLPASVLYQVTLEADGRRHFSYISASAERIVGIPAADLLADMDTLFSRIDPEQLPALRQVQIDTLEGGDVSFDCRVRQPDGQWRWIAMRSRQRQANGNGQRIWDGSFTDITAIKENEARLAERLAAEQALKEKLEEAHNQLLQAEKLAAIGQLAAGVAHELNNPIGFVHSNLGTLSEYASTLINLCDSYTTLIEDAQPDCPQLAEIRRIKQEEDYNYLRGDIFPLLEESREGLIRVRRIVQDLRDFSRTGNQDWGLADLHKGLDSTLNIVANELKYKCTVKKEYAALPEIECVISQLNQVFMNLLVNAAQAIENRGEITIRTGLEDADHVWISISDTGKGIAPEHLSRIYDPFFTTKPVGVGTGLGLSLVFGIITRHHGRIDVSSTPGEGTSFRITLPIRQPDPPEAA